MTNYVKLNEREALYIQVLDSVGMSKKEIADRFNYKYMDVVNVLRGNCFNNVTGILQVNGIPENKLIDTVTLLMTGESYRAVADIVGIEYNKVRNVLGYLKYKNLIKEQ